MCNVSLVGQWQSELAKVLTTPLNIHQYHGPRRLKDAQSLEPFDIVVTTYSILGTEWGSARKAAEKAAAKESWKCEAVDPKSQRTCGHINKPKDDKCVRCARGYKNLHAIIVRLRSTKYKPPCETVHWTRVVLDESHYVKNPAAQWSKACLGLQADNRWCVTGTPMGTNIADMASQLEFLKLNWSGSVSALSNALGGTNGRSSAGIAMQEATLYRLARSIMRHTTAQRRNGKSLLDLPGRTDRVIKIDFLPRERKAYDTIAADVRKVWAKLVKSEAVMSNMIQVLAMLAVLRVACSPGPSMLPAPKKDGTGGGTAAASVPSREPEELEECPICFEEMESPTKTACGHSFCGECILNTLNSAADAQDQLCPVCRTQISVKSLKTPTPDVVGSGGGGGGRRRGETALRGIAGTGTGVSEQTRAAYGACFLDSKFRVLIQELVAVRARDPTAKSVVFSQFTSTVEALKPRLLKAGFSWRSLSGNMTLQARVQALEEFQNDPPTTIFLISIRAGACGINLTQVRAQRGTLVYIGVRPDSNQPCFYFPPSRQIKCFF